MQPVKQLRNEAAETRRRFVSKHGGESSSELWFHAAHALRKGRTTELDLVGGEPLDHPHGSTAERTHPESEGPADRLQPELERGVILVQRAAGEDRVAGMRHDAGWRGSRWPTGQQS